MSRNRIKSIMYAFLIPVTIALRDIDPVVIATENKCNEVGKGTSDWVEADDTEDASVFLDDKLYYVLSLPESYKRCPANPCAPCEKGWMRPPPGLDELPSEKWGGISKRDIFKG